MSENDAKRFIAENTNDRRSLAEMRKAEMFGQGHVVHSWYPNGEIRPEMHEGNRADCPSCK